MKKIIIVGVIATILVAIILNHKNIYRLYKLNQIKNDFINILNGKFNDRTYPNTIKEYERYHKSIEELNHYNITKIIEAYIDMVNNGVSLYSLRKQGIEKEYKQKDYGFVYALKGLEYGKDMQIDCGDLAEYISYDINDEDVENYINGTFNDVLVEKLKTCLDYEEKDDKIEWQINSTEDKRIELPYNCYLDYTAYHRQDNKEFKKAVDVIFSKEFKLREKGNFVIVKYETSSGILKEQEVRAYYASLGDTEYYDISFSNLLIIDADTIAKVKFGSHTCDRMGEEAESKFYEEYYSNPENYAIEMFDLDEHILKQKKALEEEKKRDGSRN